MGGWVREKGKGWGRLTCVNGTAWESAGQAEWEKVPRTRVTDSASKREKKRLGILVPTDECNRCPSKHLLTIPSTRSRIN